MKVVGSSSDPRAVASATVAVAATVAALVASKAARDTLFLSSFAVEQLPTLMGAAAVASLLAALLAAWSFEKLSPARALPLAFATSALLHGVEIWLLPAHPGWVAIGFYIHVAIFSATLLTGVWALINEGFDPHQAKQQVARIALGGPVGGVLGGLAGWQLATVGGVGLGVALVAALHALAIPAVIVLGRVTSGLTTRGGRKDAATERARRVQGTGYLRDVAILVALVAIISTLLDYVLSARVARQLEPGPPMMAFFALFHMVVGILSFFLQATLARASLERLGIAGTISLLPVATAGLAVAPLLSATLAAAVAMRATNGFLAGSLYRAGYELLYTPLSRKQKRPAKMLIDVGVDRIGNALGAGILVSLALAPLAAERGPLLLACILCVLAALQSLRLHRGYVAALTTSIKGGMVDLTQLEVFDRVTRRTLAESQALNRQELLAAIAEHRERPLTSERPPSEAPAPGRPELTFGGSDAGFPTGWDPLRWGASDPDPVLDAMAVLRSGRKDEIRALLADRDVLEPELVSSVISLLADDAVAHSALALLRRHVARHTGQLVDALLDPAGNPVVRRRIPRVLERSAENRVALGLVEALFDSSLDVRIQSALALLELTEQNPALVVPKERVLDAVRRELDRASRAESRGELGQGDWDPRTERRVVRGLEFSVLALSLVYEREPLQLAYRATQSADPVLRGTALEYFDAILPDDIKRRGLPFLEVEAPPSIGKRRPSELVRELLKTRDA